VTMKHIPHARFDMFSVSGDIPVPFAIVQQTPPAARRALWPVFQKYGRYFQRTFQYDFPPCGLWPQGEDIDVAITGHDAWLLHGTVIYGVAGFRQTDWDGRRLWELAYAWVHPLVREQGYFLEMWERVAPQLAPLLIMPPLSGSMRRFATAHPQFLHQSAVDYALEGERSKSDADTKV
jgi:hypothetical protein